MAPQTMMEMANRYQFLRYFLMRPEKSKSISALFLSKFSMNILGILKQGDYLTNNAIMREAITDTPLIMVEIIDTLNCLLLL